MWHQVTHIIRGDTLFEFTYFNVEYCDILQVTYYLKCQNSSDTNYLRWYIIWGDTYCDIFHVTYYLKWHSCISRDTVFKVTYFKEDTLCEVTLFHVRHMISTDRFIYVLFFFLIGVLHHTQDWFTCITAILIGGYWRAVLHIGGLQGQKGSHVTWEVTHVLSRDACFKWQHFINWHTLCGMFLFQMTCILKDPS